jgi:hypothetical protein
MKHLLRKHIIVLFVLISASAYSQDSTKFIIGGGLSGSYDSYTYEDSDRNNESYTLGLKGMFGYKLSTNKIIGTDLEVLYSKHSIRSKVAVQVIPFFRYIFKNNMFAQVHIGANIITDHLDFNDNTTSDLLFIAGAGVGYDIKLTDNVSLQPQFRCSYVKDLDAKEYQTSDYMIVSSLTIDFVYKF